MKYFSTGFRTPKHDNIPGVLEEAVKRLLIFSAMLTLSAKTALFGITCLFKHSDKTLTALHDELAEPDNAP